MQLEMPWQRPIVIGNRPVKFLFLSSAVCVVLLNGAVKYFGVRWFISSLFRLVLFASLILCPSRFLVVHLSHSQHMYFENRSELWSLDLIIYAVAAGCALTGRWMTRREGLNVTLLPSSRNWDLCPRWPSLVAVSVPVSALVYWALLWYSGSPGILWIIISFISIFPNFHYFHLPYTRFIVLHLLSYFPSNYVAIHLMQQYLLLRLPNIITIIITDVRGLIYDTSNLPKITHGSFDKLYRINLGNHFCN